jgi:hypothetical protein
VIARSKEIDSILTDDMHQTMLLSDPSRPYICTRIHEWFWLANTAERVAHNGFAQCQEAQCGSPVRLDPVVEIVTKLGLKHNAS